MSASAVTVNHTSACVWKPYVEGAATQVSAVAPSSSIVPFGVSLAPHSYAVSDTLQLHRAESGKTKYLATSGDYYFLLHNASRILSWLIHQESAQLVQKLRNRKMALAGLHRHAY